MSRTELAQVMPWRERVPCNGTASPGHRLFEASADQRLLHGNNYEQRFAWKNSAENVQGEALFFIVYLAARLRHAKRVGSILWYPFSPWQNSSELGSAHGLSKALLLVVKVVFVVFPHQQVAFSASPF